MFNAAEVELNLDIDLTKNLEEIAQTTMTNYKALSICQNWHRKSENKLFYLCFYEPIFFALEITLLVANAPPLRTLCT